MNPTDNKLDIFALGTRPEKPKAGLSRLAVKIKAVRDAWVGFVEKSAKTRAEKKASYAVFAKSSWDKAKADRAEADRAVMENIGQPRWDHYCATAKNKAAAEVKSELAYREARSKASGAKVKATLITWKIAKADYKADQSDTKTTAAVDAAKLAWEKASEQAKRDKEAVEAVKARDKAAAAHTKAKEKEKNAADRCHQTARLLNDAEASGLKAEVHTAKAEVETVTAKSMLDWAREAVAEAKVAVKAAADPAAKSEAETELAKAQAHAEITMVAFARSKEKYAFAKAKIKTAFDEPRLTGAEVEVKEAKTDFIKVVWDNAEAEAARTIAKAEVELAEIVWARANDAATHAIARSEQPGTPSA